MPQGPIPVFTQYLGGTSRALNVNAAAVIKATPGAIMRIFVETVGSGGALTINDNNATSGNNAANQIYTAANTALTAGQVITLECPCATGITVSAVTTGGVFAVTYS